MPNVASIPSAPPPKSYAEKPQPVNGVPFAAPIAVGFWPIRTRNGQGRTISFKDTTGQVHGNDARRFTALRQNGARYHVGLDIYGDFDDIIVTPEAGRIVNFYSFYSGTDALIFQGDSSTVINFGEVRAGSHKDFGHTKGSRVEAGRPIARVGKMESGSSMCHFETYTQGTTVNARWMVGTTPPPNLLDPTMYLLYLAANGG
jgi:hypothetical protein